MDSGRSGSMKNACHMPSQICSSVSTPTLVRAACVLNNELTAKSREPARRSVGGNFANTSLELMGSTSGSAVDASLK